MNTIKNINPLFDNNYYKELFLSELFNDIKFDLRKIPNEWIMISLYNRAGNTEGYETTKVLNWKKFAKLKNIDGYFASGYIDEKNGEVVADKTSKTVTMINFDFLDLVKKDKLLTVCEKYKFKYVWFSIHIGPQEIPAHVDKGLGLRYVQPIYKNWDDNGWTYKNESLNPSPTGAFVFDPKFMHSLCTPKDCISVYLIADCIENKIEEWND